MFARLAASTTTATGPGLAARSIVRRAVALVTAIAEALRHRRQVMGMLDLDERALKDIGLTRSDVVGVLQTPLRYDPSLGLKQIATERELRMLALEGAVRLRRESRSRRAA